MRVFAKFFTLASFFLISQFSHARLLQIIHTNDLHSYFTGYYDNRGGYSRVMTKIKELKAEANAKGIEVLQLDAGDWGEGTSFFLSANGVDSLKALEMLGVEVAAIGNHDHLVGGNVLGKQIRSSGVSTKFVSANLVSTPDMELGDTVVPYVDVERAGISIRIIGLTTDEAFFQYSIAPGKIADPLPIGESQGKAAKASGKELVIALSHLGVNRDEALVNKSTSLDVIIGGHSHTKLSEVDWKKNLNGKNIPIVQAWAHGLSVGSLLLDVDDKGAVTVVDYKLHDVGVPIAPDPDMEKFVQESSARRNENFTYKWDEVIGETEIPMSGYQNGHATGTSNCWGHHMATAAKEAAGASIGIHVASFEGVYRPPGPVTYADIASNFPHFRKFGDQGWEIAKVYISGWKLRPILWWASRHNYGITFSGLGYATNPDGSKSLTVNDEEVNEKGVYSIAFPAEVALAIQTSFPQYRQYLQGLKYTGQFYWPVVMNYVKKNSPIKCH